MKLLKIFTIVFAVIILTGCDGINQTDNLFVDPNNQNDRSNEDFSVMLENGKTPDDFVIDHYEIISANVLDDKLFLNLNYSGGCEDHSFGLVAYNYFMESYPVQVYLVLTHDAKDDACDAIVNKELECDLSPLKHEYFLSYGNTNDAIVLNILVDKESNNFLRFTYNSQALYANSFETHEDTAGWAGITYNMFVADPAPECGRKSLYIGGGCIQPAATKKITIPENGYYTISCWGKTNLNGGHVILRKSDREEISIFISAKEWTHYYTDSKLYCEAGIDITLEFLVGGIVYDDLFCDGLTIFKM